MNVVKCLGICVEPPILVMGTIIFFDDYGSFTCFTEFMKNGCLSDYLAEHSNISMSQKLTFMCEIASGMNHLHHEGVIHKDLAARNILV